MRNLCPLSEELGRAGTPILVVAGSEQLHSFDESSVEAIILLPADPDEIAGAAHTIAGQRQEKRREIIDVGDLRLDLAQRVAFIDGEQLQLPPKEFFILVQLALHPGVPLSSPELVVRIWDDPTAVTSEDVRRHVYLICPATA